MARAWEGWNMDAAAFSWTGRPRLLGRGVALTWCRAWVWQKSIDARSRRDGAPEQNGGLDDIWRCADCLHMACIGVGHGQTYKPQLGISSMHGRMSVGCSELGEGD